MARRVAGQRASKGVSLRLQKRSVLRYPIPSC
jgi:hypothetical protein